MLVIREYSPGDLNAVAELMGELGYPSSEEQVQQRLAAIHANPANRTYVAEREGRVTGMIGLRLLNSYEGDLPVVHIAALVTKAECRGQGIGKELVNRAERWAKEKGAGAVVLTSGNRPEREAAHRFYEHLGYAASGFRFSKKL